MKMTQICKASRNLVKYSVLGLAVAAMLGAGSAQAATITNVLNLGEAGSGTSIAGGEEVAWLSPGALPVGSILRRVSIDVIMDENPGGSWASDLNVKVGDTLLIGSDGDGLLDWANGQDETEGTPCIDTKTDADWSTLGAIDLTTTGISLKNCYGDATWSGTITIEYDISGLTVKLSNPTNGSVYLVGATIPVTATVLAGTAPYTVEFFLDSGSGFVSQGTDSESPYTNDLTGLTNGAYSIKATVSDDDSATAESVTRTFTVSNAGPTGLAAVPGDKLVTLSWNPVLGATGYKVFRSSPDNTSYSVIATNITGLTYQNTGLVIGTLYYYVVKATVGATVSDPSNEVSATPSEVNAGRSTVVASPTTMPANGTDTAAVTVTLKDAAGYVVAGKDVTLSYTGTGTIAITPSATQTTDPSGKAVFLVGPTTIAGIYTFTATADPSGTPVVITQKAILNTTLVISTVALDVSGSGTGAEILNDGKLVVANHFGPTGIGPVTVNDVLFGTSWAHMTSGWNPSGQWTDVDSGGRVPSLTDGTDFGKLMREYIWTSANNTCVDIPGLIVGKTYRLQWITSSPRGGNISVEGSASVPHAPTSQPESNYPRVLAFTWVATDTTANVLVTRQPGSYNSDNEPLFNGYVLHDVTKPAGTVLLLF